MEIVVPERNSSLKCQDQQTLWRKKYKIKKEKKRKKLPYHSNLITIWWFAKKKVIFERQFEKRKILLRAPFLFCAEKE